MAFAFISLLTFSLPWNTLSVSPKTVSPKLQFLIPQRKFFVLCNLDTNYCSRAGTWERKVTTKPGKQRHTGTCEGEQWGLTGTPTRCSSLEGSSFDDRGVPAGRPGMRLAGGGDPVWLRELQPRQQGDPGDKLWVCCYCTAHSTPTCPAHKHAAITSTCPPCSKTSLVAHTDLEWHNRGNSGKHSSSLPKWTHYKFTTTDPVVVVFLFYLSHSSG